MRRWKNVLLGMMSAMLVCAPNTFAMAGAFVDDKSSPRQLIHSFYNALNLNQTARAFDYWSTDGLATDLAQSAIAPMQDMAHIDVFVADVMEDATAGTTYYAVSVAVNAISETGNVRAFAGCYFLKAPNPALQDVPFAPMHIYGASMLEVPQPYTRQAPQNCAP